MHSIIHNYTINEDILNLISKIMEKIGKLNGNYLYKEKNNWHNLFNKINPYDINYLLSMNNINNITFVENVFDFLNNNKNKIHLIILSIIVYLNFVLAEPFKNKNEKISKVWFQLLLINFNNIFEFVSLNDEINIHNQEFINAVKSSYKDNDATIFIMYILNIINNYLESILNKNTITIKNVNIEKLLNIMDNKPMTAYEIMEKLNIKSKETFRNSYMNLAIKKGLVSLTNPDKPTSRNQMYYKTSNYI